MTTFADMLQRNWPGLLRALGESAVYTATDGTDTTFTCVATGRPETANLDLTWDVAARQIELHAAASDVPATVTARQDTITVRGVTFSVIERVTAQGGIYRYLCEQVELEGVQHRGRRF
jgi:hypothetical protein